MTPENEAGVNHIILWYGNETWFVDAKEFCDDGGPRLEVFVEDSLYIEDVMPRLLKTPMGKCYLVVIRVDKLLKFEKPPQIAKA